MDPVKRFFNRVDYWSDILMYGVCWLVLDRHLVCLVVDVIDDIVVLYWVDCLVSEVGAYF